MIKRKDKCSEIGKKPNEEKNPKMYTEDEVNELLQKRIGEEKQSWNEGNKERFEAERQKAEKFASMPEDERMKAKFDEKVELFENEKKQYMGEKMQFEATKILAKENLPVSFAKLLAGSDIDETTENINVFKTEFLKALEENLNERLKGKTPMTNSIVENNDPFLAGFGN